MKKWLCQSNSMALSPWRRLPRAQCAAHLENVYAAVLRLREAATMEAAWPAIMYKFGQQGAFLSRGVPTGGGRVCKTPL